MTRALTRGRLRARIVSVAVIANIVLLAACGPDTRAAPAEATASASPSVTKVGGWPSALAALGHSGLTGYDSEHPQADAKGNSWATGDNPAVNSVYLRVLAENPAIKDHVSNLAVDGSDVVDLLRQAHDLASLIPKPELIIIQSIDNDMQCDGTDAEHLPIYRAGLVEVMDALMTSVPDATVFFVSPWSSAEIYDAAVSQIDPSHVAGTGPCDTVDPDTLEVVPEKEAQLQALVEAYFGTIIDVCSAYKNCLTDDGAMQSLALDPQDLTPDLNHLMATGHAKMAAIAWDVLYPNA